MTQSKSRLGPTVNLNHAEDMHIEYTSRHQESVVKGTESPMHHLGNQKGLPSLQPSTPPPPKLQLLMEYVFVHVQILLPSKVK